MWEVTCSLNSDNERVKIENFIVKHDNYLGNCHHPGF